MNATPPSAYSHDLRVLLCEYCGAPLEAPTQGGQVRCRYCGALSQLAPRGESAEIASRAGRPHVDEGVRLARLRAQDGRPLLPPPNLSHYVHEGALRGERFQEAMRDWSETRASLARGGGFPLEERLFFLTSMLVTPLGASGDFTRQRAVIESAIELSSSPLYKHSLRCMLARNAVRAGDLRAAEAWIAACDPSSDDLHVDSELRCTRAYVATARGDWPGVLTSLGSRTRDLPIAGHLARLCGLLRANAHEKLGRLDLAGSELHELCRAGETPDSLRASIGVNAALGLCPLSMAQLRPVRVDADESDRPALLAVLPVAAFGVAVLCFVAAQSVAPEAMIGAGYSLPTVLRIVGACFGVPAVVAYKIVQARASRG